jgi:hypothetical protein
MPPGILKIETRGRSLYALAFLVPERSDPDERKLDLDARYPISLTDSELQ